MGGGGLSLMNGHANWGGMKEKRRTVWSSGRNRIVGAAAGKREEEAGGKRGLIGKRR